MSSITRCSSLTRAHCECPAQQLCRSTRGVLSFSGSLLAAASSATLTSSSPAWGNAPAARRKNRCKFGGT
ncbi:hypothetical protein DAT35_35630 [Vitiosangium sp. GDMCC 1.1324]|nr:hypothetical protein DAT35_35630 [Vitiosangium sp. GDMCC 1.1324]